MTNSAIIIPRARLHSIDEREKITNFPANPAKGGKPTRLNRIVAKQITTPGAVRTRPA